MRDRVWRRIVRALILLIGLHSCILGILMLFAPHFMLTVFGFPDSDTIFFPSQSGIFLLILGAFYLYGFADLTLVRLILLSKAVAVVFLSFHAAFLSAPRSIWAAAAGDAAMLIGLAAAWHGYRRSGRLDAGDASGFQRRY